jgi:phosphatidylinositol kinase/protein kinase (PI-3  family)
VCVCVWYRLGLGDRHPSNLMLDRISGRIVHIDFGDCFEVRYLGLARPMGWRGGVGGCLDVG